MTRESARNEYIQYLTASALFQTPQLEILHSSLTLPSWLMTRNSATFYASFALVFLNAFLLLGQVWNQTTIAMHKRGLCISDTLFIVVHTRIFGSLVELPNYSYIGQDYPLVYPMDPLEIVAMTLHESVHFSLNVSDRVALDEWILYSSIPKGIGRTRLGPQQRVFVITVSHQMHCLRRIQAALLNRQDPLAKPAHVSHCLNYLRQTLLCEGADMLERGDFMERVYDVERVGDTLICSDWERAFELLDRKYEQWQAWREVWN